MKFEGKDVEQENIYHLDLLCDLHKYLVLITQICLLYKLQNFAVVSAIAITGSVLPR